MLQSFEELMAHAREQEARVQRLFQAPDMELIGLLARIAAASALALLVR